MNGGHTTEEQILYRGVSMARNLAHLGYHDKAAVVARMAAEIYHEEGCNS